MSLQLLLKDTASVTVNPSHAAICVSISGVPYVKSAAAVTVNFLIATDIGVTVLAPNGSGAALTGITGSQVANTPAGGIAATTVQAAVNELDTEKAPKVGAGDIEITDTNKGIILTAPNASRWRLQVDNLGVLTASAA